MVAYTRDEIISATELARNVSATLNSLVNQEKEKIAIMKNNKIETVMISIDEYERLKEADEYMKKNFKNMKRQYAEEILKYTYPVFIQKIENDKPELIATSIIINLDNKFYLVTAAHVVNDVINAKSSFFIGANNSIVSTDCEICYSVANNDTGKDNFDIGFFELDKKFIEDNKIISFNVNEKSVAGNPKSRNRNFPTERNRKSRLL
jgi:PHD/YefM family antitoxin component YafN of YafNO toxin-antitoxin module